MISSIEDMMSLCVLESPASNADDDISDFFFLVKMMTASMVFTGIKLGKSWKTSRAPQKAFSN